MKIHIGKQLVDIFHSNPLVAVFHHNDWNVAEWQKFRRTLLPTGIRVRVISTRIATKVLEPTKFRNITSLFHGPTCLMYCEEPKVKDLVSVTKNEDKLLLLGGVLNNALLTRQDFIDYAKLPTHEELHGQLISQLMMMSSQMTSLLLRHQRNLLSILSQRQ